MFGTKKWKIISMYFNRIFHDNPKNSKICKERWFDNLDSNSQKKGWSLIEDFIFYECRKVLGNKWASISKYIPGRTDNDIKNHSYSTLRKNMARIIKGKNQSNCIKDKLDRYYSLMHSREKFISLKRFYIEATNEVDLNEAKKVISDVSGNYDDEFIANLILTTHGSLDTLDKFINILCEDILNQKSDSNLIDENILFDVKDNKPFQNQSQIHNKIRNIVNNSALSVSLKYINENNILEDCITTKLKQEEIVESDNNNISVINNISINKKSKDHDHNYALMHRRHIHKLAHTHSDNHLQINNYNSQKIKGISKPIKEEQLGKIISSFVEKYYSGSISENLSKGHIEFDPIENIISSVFKNEAFPNNSYSLNTKSNLTPENIKTTNEKSYEKAHTQISDLNFGTLNKTIEQAIVENFLGEYTIDGENKFIMPKTQNELGNQNKFDKEMQYLFNFYENLYES